MALCTSWRLRPASVLWAADDSMFAAALGVERWEERD